MTAALATATPPTNVLALDLGTTTGFALKQGEMPTLTGSVQFKNSRYEGGGMRFLRFRKWLETLNDRDGVDVVYFEEVRRHLGTDAAHVYGGLLAMLTAWCEVNRIPYQGVPVGTIKRHATGKGNANKGAMINAAKGYGFNPSDDNEADAICLLKLACDEIGASF